MGNTTDLAAVTDDPKTTALLPQQYIFDLFHANTFVQPITWLRASTKSRELVDRVSGIE